MNIHIKHSITSGRTQGFSLEGIERRLRLELTRFSSEITAIHCMLCEEDRGDRRTEFRCSVSVQRSDDRVVAAESVAAHPETAAAITTRKLHRRLSRESGGRHYRI